jgi:hypothetical protein
MALMLRKISGNGFFLMLSLGMLGCASAAPNPEPEVEARLSRSGGLSGIAETVRLWLGDGEPHATVQRSNEKRARNITLARKTLDSSLVVLESLVGVVPAIPPDTGVLRPLCGDAILTRVQVRRGSRVQSAQEECPHRTPTSETYWQRVDSLFRLLASAPR